MSEHQQTEACEVPELDAIQRMNLERRIAGGIFAGLLLLCGVIYALFPASTMMVLEPDPAFEHEGNMPEGEWDAVGGEEAVRIIQSPAV